MTAAMSGRASASWGRSRPSLDRNYDTPGGAPATVVGKFPTADPTSLGVAVPSTSIRAGRLLHRSSRSSPIRTPRLLHAEDHYERPRLRAAAEDLRDVTHGDQITGLTPAQARSSGHCPWTPTRRLAVGQGQCGQHGTLFDFANPSTAPRAGATPGRISDPRFRENAS